MLLLGLGMGTAFMPAMSLATHGVEPRDAGVASAMVNTSQQVGGAIGTALLNTIAAVRDDLVHHGPHRRRPPPSPSSSWSSSRAWCTATPAPSGGAVGILAGAAVIALTLVNAGRPKADSSTGEGPEAQVPVIAH